MTFIGVDGEGNLNLGDLERAIQPETAIVSVMWANNETGVIFPVEEIAGIARRKRVFFHTDAVQVVGKVPLRLRDLPINSLSLSAHKFHGPKGVGALYVNRRSAFRPMLFGGDQENSRRAGTENVASIIGLGKAAERAAQSLGEEATRVREMRDNFENAILADVTDTVVNGGSTTRLPNTASLSFAGIESGAALMMLDQQGLCCSAGSACRTGSLQASHVLRAMNLSDDRMRGSMRFSFGRFNTVGEVERASGIVRETIVKLRRFSAVPEAISA